MNVPPATARCPMCGRTYTPTPDPFTEEEREQHISGICSDACWCAFLGERGGCGVCRGACIHATTEDAR